MNKKVFIEGNVSDISLSNIGELEGFDFNIDDINEEADIVEIMQQLDAYAESGELDLVTDIKKFRVMNPEDITYLGYQVDDEKEIETNLDSFTLRNTSFSPVKELLDSANVGDLIYLRKIEGKSNWEFNIDVKDKDEKLCFSYFDCTDALDHLDQYDLLSENYYNVLCDSIIPESLASDENNAIVENFDIEPQIVYVELYKVVESRTTDNKMLERVEIPGYYFLDKTRNIDE